MKRRLRVIGFDNVQLKDPKCKLILAEAWERECHVKLVGN
jgi:hypothetical protein